MPADINDQATIESSCRVPTRRAPVISRPRLGIHADHFAFMRAVAQGISAEKAWKTYLDHVEGPADRPTIRATMRRLNDEFAAAARRLGKHGTARLILFNTERLESEDSAAPTLEQYAERIGGEDWSERELLEMYIAEYGSGASSRRAHRKKRLIARRLQEIEQLRTWLVVDPSLTDALAYWLNPTLANPLNDAGITTLGELIAWINARGRNWYRKVRPIGIAKARRIESWLDAHKQGLGLAIAPHARVDAEPLPPSEVVAFTPPSFGIRPINLLAVPAQLDGRAGRFRRPQHECLLKAETDVQAIGAWLATKAGIPMMSRHDASGAADLTATQRIYLGAAERLLLWSLHVAGKPISSLDAEDAAQFSAFLRDPQPAERWMGEHPQPRSSLWWRPFVRGQMSAVTWRNNIVIVSGLFKFLVGQAYVSGNPFSAIHVPRHLESRKIDTSRSFTLDQWDMVQHALIERPRGEDTARLKAVLALLYSTGIRLSELAGASCADLAFRTFPATHNKKANAGWALTVLGKGGKERTVFVPEAVIGELKDYAVLRGLEGALDHPSNATAYLIGPLRAAASVGHNRTLASDQRAGISGSALYKMLKRFFAEIADSLEDGDPESVARFRAASTHWLRHTHGSHMLARGGNIKQLQERFGHASLATTTIYSDVEEREMLEETQRLFGEVV